MPFASSASHRDTERFCRHCERVFLDVPPNHVHFNSTTALWLQSWPLAGLVAELLSLVHTSGHTMKTTLQTILPVIALLVWGYQASAQLDLRIMLDPSALKFFDQKSAFSANAEVITEVDGKPDVMPVKIAILGNL